MFTRLASVAVLVAAVTACLPKPKSEATLISPRELGVPKLQLKMTAPEGVAAFEAATYEYVTEANGGLRIDVNADGYHTALHLLPATGTKTADEVSEEMQHQVKDYKEIEKGSLGDGWFLMYSEYVPAHVYKDAYGEQKFANSEQVQTLVSRVRVNDAWYVCSMRSSAVSVIKLGAKLCGSVEPWTPPAAPKG